MAEPKVRNVDGDDESPSLNAPGGLVQSGGYMAKAQIESATGRWHRQDAAQQVANAVSRKYRGFDELDKSTMDNINDEAQQRRGKP